jgi:uncharacterized protein YdcH (DUF465 family)
MSTLQSLNNRLESLKEKHKELDKQVDIEYNNFTRDEIVEKHKIQKLRLKDEMISIEKQIKDLSNGNK